VQATMRRSHVADAEIPDDVLYSEDDRWIKVEEGIAIIGITHHAQKELGDVIFVELPEVNVDIDIGDEIGTIESIKTTTDVIAPISGRIEEVNDRLERKPELLNNDPYGLGWIARIVIKDPREVEDLLSPDDYAQAIDERE
jgi:glycine cleavage system H protein